MYQYIWDTETGGLLLTSDLSKFSKEPRPVYYRELDILGFDWGRVQGVNVLRDMANNPGAGGVAAAGASMGMGIGAAGAFGSIAQQVFAPANNGFAPQSPIQQQPSGRFTQKQPEAETKQEVQADPVEILGKLKKMLDAGLIEQAEYDAKKADILSRM